MQDFEQLEVWKKAHELALLTYSLTDGYPASERYGLAQQMRRAAVSVPTNIAEGAGRASNADFARFLGIARGSTSELQYQSRLARDLGLSTDAEHSELSGQAQEIRRMLTALIARVTEANN